MVTSSDVNFVGACLNSPSDDSTHQGEGAPQAFALFMLTLYPVTLSVSFALQELQHKYDASSGGAEAQRAPG